MKSNPKSGQQSSLKTSLRHPQKSLELKVHTVTIISILHPGTFWIRRLRIPSEKIPYAVYTTFEVEPHEEASVFHWPMHVLRILICAWANKPRMVQYLLDTSVCPSLVNKSILPMQWWNHIRPAGYHNLPFRSNRSGTSMVTYQCSNKTVISTIAFSSEVSRILALKCSRASLLFLAAFGANSRANIRSSHSTHALCRALSSLQTVSSFFSEISLSTVQSSHAGKSSEENNDKEVNEFHLCRLSRQFKYKSIERSCSSFRCYVKRLLLMETHPNAGNQRWSTDASEEIQILLDVPFYTYIANLFAKSIALRFYRSQW